MLPELSALRQCLKTAIAAERAAGRAVDGMHEELAAYPESHDALLAFARRLATAPPRAGWRYVEPETWAEIKAECDPARPRGRVGEIAAEDAAARIEAAFLGSVCGCILGKPVELNPTLADLRTALEARGEWPLADYFSRDFRPPGKTALHVDAWHTTRETLRYVAPDDDLNYTLLGMLNLEAHGAAFTHDQLEALWLRHVSPEMTWGPERAFMARAALRQWARSFGGGDTPGADHQEWARLFNPHGELCGALIRADAYGYACPGHPALAAELAWRDASLTHRRTGVYGAMWAAAAIATAFVERDRLRVFEVALQFVPRRSRFYHIVSDALHEVATATDWLDGYARIHRKYRDYSHCQVHQECGTLINTLRFAESVGDGICKQVSQGNDTDSFGATAGSILGAWFGPGHLEARWLTPFRDKIRTGLNFFPEHSLRAVAARLARLPAVIAQTCESGETAPPPSDDPLTP